MWNLPRHALTGWQPSLPRLYGTQMTGLPLMMSGWKTTTACSLSRNSQNSSTSPSEPCTPGATAERVPWAFASANTSDTGGPMSTTGSETESAMRGRRDNWIGPAPGRRRKLLDRVGGGIDNRAEQRTWGPEMASIERRQTASGETRWDVRYRGPDQRHRTRTFHRKADAQRFASVVEADIARGEWLDPQLGKETFGDWAARWVPTIAGLTPKTRESYESILRRHLLSRFADTPVNRIDHPTVVGLLAELTASGAGAGTVRNVRDVLRLVLELARRSGAIKVNPVEGAKAPKKPPAEMVFLDASQIMTLADEITNPPIRTGGGEHRRRSYPGARSPGPLRRVHGAAVCRDRGTPDRIC